MASQKERRNTFRYSPMPVKLSRVAWVALAAGSAAVKAYTAMMTMGMTTNRAIQIT